MGFATAGNPLDWTPRDIGPPLSLLSCALLNLSLFFFAILRSCGILVPWPGIEPVSPALQARSLNHWIAKETSSVSFDTHRNWAEEKQGWDSVPQGQPLQRLDCGEKAWERQCEINTWNGEKKDQKVISFLDASCLTSHQGPVPVPVGPPWAQSH